MSSGTYRNSNTSLSADLCLLLPLCHCSVLDNSFSFFSFTFQLLPFGSRAPFFLAPSLKRSCQYILGFLWFQRCLPLHTYLGLPQFLFPIKFTPPLTPPKELHSTTAYTKSSLLCSMFLMFLSSSVSEQFLVLPCKITLQPLSNFLPS